VNHKPVPLSPWSEAKGAEAVQRRFAASAALQRDSWLAEPERLHLPDGSGYDAADPVRE